MNNEDVYISVDSISTVTKRIMSIDSKITDIAVCSVVGGGTYHIDWNLIKPYTENNEESRGETIQPKKRVGKSYQ